VVGGGKGMRLQGGGKRKRSRVGTTREPHQGDFVLEGLCVKSFEQRLAKGKGKVRIVLIRLV